MEGKPQFHLITILNDLETINTLSWELLFPVKQ